MSDLVKRLCPKEQRASKPRRHLLTHGPRDLVAERLSALAAPFATVFPYDHWHHLYVPQHRLACRRLSCQKEGRWNVRTSWGLDGAG